MRENTCVTCTWYMDSSGKKKNEESRKEMPGHRQGNNLRFSEAIIIVMLCYVMRIIIKSGKDFNLNVSGYLKRQIILNH